MEKFNGETYPPCVKKLLIASGFNKFIALAGIGEEELLKIERHINSEPGLINNLKCCYSDVYKDQEVFQFLPGHKATILGMKTQIQQLKAHWTENPEEANKSKTSLKRNRVLDRTADEVKSILIESLRAFLKKHKVPEQIITARNIVNFKEEAEGDRKTYRCEFSCLFCSKRIAVLYKKFWMNSNVTKHLKDHVTDSNFKMSYEEIEIATFDENDP